MDYEKKYKEALERAKIWKDKSGMPKDKQGILDDIFPELTENEDERIRKRLIHFVENWKIFNPDSPFDDYAVYTSDSGECDKILAWLEKQKPISFSNNEDKRIIKEIISIVKSYRDSCITEGNHRFDDCISWLEKQTEQKPTDKDEPKFKVKYAGSEYNVFETKDIAGVTFYGIEDEPNHIDYVKAENCEIISVYAIKENGSPYPTKPAVFSEKKPKRMISAEAKEAMYDKPAWSEEDEHRVEDTIYFLDTAKKHYASTVELDACIDWLKSLKGRVQPQSHWKPSKNRKKI